MGSCILNYNKQTKEKCVETDNEELKQFFEKLKYTKEDNKIVVELTKEQLLSPLLKQCLEEGLFKTDTGIKYEFACYEQFVLNPKEAKAFAQNATAILKSHTDMWFYEKKEGGSNILSSLKTILLSYQIEDLGYFRYSLEQVLGINIKLAEYAKKIKSLTVTKNGITRNLSPFEKYLLCYKIIENVPYTLYEDTNNEIELSRSFYATVLNNRGCCVGKAFFLKALLKMVGIDSCVIAVNSTASNLAFHDNSIQMIQNTPMDFFERYGENKGIEFHLETKVYRYYLSKLQSTFLVELKAPNHAINLVYLDDKNYGISGVFASDATDEPLERLCLFDDIIDAYMSIGPFKNSKYDKDLCTYADLIDPKYSLELIEFAGSLDKKSLCLSLTPEKQALVEEEVLVKLRQLILADFNKFVAKYDIPSSNLATASLTKARDIITCASSIDSITKNTQKLVVSPNTKVNKQHPLLKLVTDKDSELLGRISDAVEAKLAWEKLPQTEMPSLEMLAKAVETIMPLYEQNFANEDGNLK